MESKIVSINHQQYDNIENYSQSLEIYRTHPGQDYKYFNATTPARFARFMAIVIAFAARHDKERNNANNS